MTTTTPSITTPTSTAATIGAPAIPNIAPGNLVIGIDSLPTYDGTTGINEFLSVIEETSVLANWTSQQMVAIARLKLRHRAKQFIDSEPALLTTQSWTTLKESLKKQFTRQHVKGSAMKNFMECRQKSGESCRQFLTRLKLLGNRTITLTGDPANDDPIQRKLEQDITTQFILGLMMPIKQRVLSGNPQTLDEALSVAEREESIENLIHPSSSRECRGVNWTPAGKQNGYSSNNASKAKVFKCDKCKKMGHTEKFCRSATQIVCFYCNKPGHFKSSCPQNDARYQQRKPNFTERLCYTCKQPGHLARNCPRNQQGPRQALNTNAATSQPRSSAAQEANWE